MRKPIDAELRGLQTPRERVWDALRSFGKASFSKNEVQDRCSPMVLWTVVDDYLVVLEKAGYLERVSGTGVKPGVKGEPIRYKCVQAKCTGVAPRLNKQGEPVVQGLANEAMWRAMKVLRAFDHNDIAKAATVGDLRVSPATAKSYVLHLARAGYLSEVRKSKPGTPAKHQLVKNTGPNAPAITRRKVVFDRNVGEFVGLDTAQEVCDALSY
jgi:hypothetical protein